ncbi:trafficking protein particle complex subunit 4 isoform X1 [Felis catus]|uniref:trafficking protein particle complex subunit 4 isoform X1 n=1 Tax=Felis catus TaxID=9685 RepID=UPI001D19A0BD|nr:trafficking protein particle complex subunit 4 isoform X1 [Felis catus]
MGEAIPPPARSSPASLGPCVWCRLHPVPALPGSHSRTTFPLGRAHHSEAQRATANTAASLRCRTKKEAALTHGPRNLHPQQAFPGQGAEPATEGRRSSPLVQRAVGRVVVVSQPRTPNTVRGLLDFAASCEVVTRRYPLVLETNKERKQSASLRNYPHDPAKGGATSAQAPALRGWEEGARGGSRDCGSGAGPSGRSRIPASEGQRPQWRFLALGHAVLAINGVDVNGKYTADGKEVLEYLGNPANYPVSIRFGRPRLTSNEKLMLASMFHSLFAIGSQLSPEQGSSGIEMLETDTFKLHCFQTLTGIKFVVLADPRQAGIDSLLRKIYEIYSDFALKNPFYSLEMPIRCELFDQNLKLALEVAEKAGTFGPGS